MLHQMDEHSTTPCIFDIDVFCVSAHSQVISAQEEEDAGDGAESIETQSMNALAQLPHHQQVRCVHPSPRAWLFSFFFVVSFRQLETDLSHMFGCLRASRVACLHFVARSTAVTFSFYLYNKRASCLIDLTTRLI